MRATLRRIHDGDIEAICSNPRAADVREMEAVGKTFEDAVVESVRISDWVACGVLDGRPVFLFGVAPLSFLSGRGVPWLLASAELDGAERLFLRTCAGVVAAMRETYPRLINVVDARNTRTIRWLGWLGFQINREPVAVNGRPFHVFHLGEN